MRNILKGQKKILENIKNSLKYKYLKKRCFVRLNFKIKIDFDYLVNIMNRNARY
jgi:hypothetical protein